MIGEKAAKGLRPFAPQAFGRYTLLAPLASGGMGEVYLGRLEGVEGFEKLVVIKKILPQLAHDDDFRGRFVSEARVLVKLHHGSVAQVLDMGEREGEYYIALEFVDGKDLRKVAARCRERGHTVPLGLTLFVMMRVLDALAYAHRKKGDDEADLNLVHRDVSPQNVLVSYEGEVKVIDFGLAKSSLSLGRTSPSVVLGKFFYMSPEQARHQPVDRRSDLYAAGICLYELIAGKNPFESVPQGELMAQVANPTIEPLGSAMPGVPPAVEQLVMRALAPDPKDRFSGAEEMRGRLMAAMLELDPAAGPESLAHFMRAVFSSEYTQERKVFSGLRESSARMLRDEARTGLMPVLQLATDTFGSEDARHLTQAAEPAVAKPFTPANAETHVGPIDPALMAQLSAPARIPQPAPASTDVFTLPLGRDEETTRPPEALELAALMGSDLDSGPTESVEFSLPDDPPGLEIRRVTDPARAPLDPGLMSEQAQRLGPPVLLQSSLQTTGPIAAVGDDPQEFQLPGHEDRSPSGPRPTLPMLSEMPLSTVPGPPVGAPASRIPGPPVVPAGRPFVTSPSAPRVPARAEPSLPKVVISAELTAPTTPAVRPRPITGTVRRSTTAPVLAPSVVTAPPPRVSSPSVPQAAKPPPEPQPSSVKTSLAIGLSIGAALVLLALAGLLAWNRFHPH